MIDLFQIFAVVGFLIAVAFHRGAVLKVLGMLVWAGAFSSDPGLRKYWAVAALALAVASLLVTARASSGQTTRAGAVSRAGGLSTRAWTAVGCACVVIVGLALAMHLGRRAAESDVARLDADLGISVMSLSVTDRALLAALAQRCDLSSRPAGRSDTVECLRSALPTTTLDPAVFPSPLSQLESLISRRGS